MAKPRPPKQEKHKQGKIPSARQLSLQILGRVLCKKQHLDAAFAACPLDRLPARDRAFVRLLTTTTLRHLGLIDRVIKACLTRPLPERQIEIKNILRLTTAQLLYLDTPPHAAVSTALDLATGPRNRPFKGLLNALLRRICREGHNLCAQDDPEICSVPPWFWARLRIQYGETRARACIRSWLREPPLDLSIKSDPEKWANRLNGQLLPNGTLRLPPGSGDPALLHGYADGAWWVQDTAARFPALLLGTVAGLRVADLCAAPGGKTATLIQAGASVLAVDLSPRRLDRLRENMVRLGYQDACTPCLSDLCDWARADSTDYDAILLDAPCSATGTLRRHPELIRIRTAGTIDALITVQNRLLEAAWTRLKPGGILVFSTCSLEQEEGENQIKAFLANHPKDAVRIPLSPEELTERAGATADKRDAFAPLITAEGDLRCLPCHWSDLGGMDGFFASRLRKNS